MIRIKPFAAAALIGLGIGVAATASSALAGDPAQGQRVWNQCRACHVLDSETNRVGPHLVGIFGREAGAVEGFRYSGVMAESGIVWDEENLRAYLSDPRGFLPGNSMAFAGVRNPTHLDNLIAYMREATEQ